MLKAWRRVAVATLAAGAAIAAQFMAVASASAATPTFTIFVTSKFAAVTNDVFVVFQAANGEGSATVHGRILGGTAGEVLTLFGQGFPYTTKPGPLRSVAITSANQTFSFPVTPVLVSHYDVRLFTSATSHIAVAESPAVTLFVLPRATSVLNKQSCGNGICHSGFNTYTFLPSVTLGTEMAKHVYPYFAVNLATPPTVPATPTVLSLNVAHPVVKVVRLHANEYLTQVGWTFAVGNDDAAWNFAFCTKDTVNTDGLGLPGSHGCGASKLTVGASTSASAYPAAIARPHVAAGQLRL